MRWIGPSDFSDGSPRSGGKFRELPTALGQFAMQPDKLECGRSSQIKQPRHFNQFFIRPTIAQPNQLFPEDSVIMYTNVKKKELVTI